MDIIYAVEVIENEICLEKVEDIGVFMNKLMNNENFILKAKNKSVLIIADKFLAKINNGEITLGSN